MLLHSVHHPTTVPHFVMKQLRQNGETKELNVSMKKNGCFYHGNTIAFVKVLSDKQRMQQHQLFFKFFDI